MEIASILSKPISRALLHLAFFAFPIFLSGTWFVVDLLIAVHRPDCSFGYLIWVIANWPAGLAVAYAIGLGLLLHFARQRTRTVMVALFSLFVLVVVYIDFELGGAIGLYVVFVGLALGALAMPLVTIVALFAMVGFVSLVCLWGAIWEARCAEGFGKRRRTSSARE